MCKKSQQLIDAFGLTQFANRAGFILPDGTMLDLSRINHAQRMYHAESLKILYGVPEKGQEWTDHDLVLLMAELSLIRFCYKGVIHSANKPTPQQYRQLYRMVSCRSNSFEVIISHPSGLTMSEYNIVAPTMKVLLDVFSDYDKSPLPICEDEFVIDEEEGQLNLIFRPLQKKIGIYQRNDKTFSLSAEYSSARSSLKKLIENYL